MSHAVIARDTLLRTFVRHWLSEGDTMRLHHSAFDVFADYRQFYLWDLGMTNQAPEEYADEDIRRRIKAGPHVVVIQTERNTTVPVAVEVHDADPGVDLAEWNHVAEASLHLPTGQLQVHECTGGPVAEFIVEPGWYRVRSLSGGLTTIDESGLEGGDYYRVILWPAPSSEVSVMKQWVPSE
jgi:hypothetical protein